ncbi:MAG: hypothetical protein CME65_13385 [Halobacteriovoraceae bacterium]|nr:hypothetical protein [Halobacteriovoraceae bacterium]
MHSAVGIVFFFAFTSEAFEESNLEIIIYCLAALGVFIDLLRFLNPKLNQNLLLIFKSLARKEEVSKFSGMTTYFVSAAVCLSILSAKTVAPFFLVVAIADPMASVMGIKWGGLKTYRDKTLIGLFTYFIIAGLILNFLGFPLQKTLILASILSLTESFVPLDDNLSVPIMGVFIQIML